MVLECTNMPPYACALSRHVGPPIYDVVTLVTWLRSGLRPAA